MSTKTIFNCDICPSKNITDGVTMVFEIDQSGDTNAPKYRVVKTIKGLYPFHEAPKVTHICNVCNESILNAKDPKSKESQK